MAASMAADGVAPRLGPRAGVLMVPSGVDAQAAINAVAINVPAIFLQGLDDKVVPPNQARAMVDALKRKGLAVAYIEFAGEQHGFRRSETLQRALDAELYFYAKVFGFDLPNAIEPVEIFNLAKEK